MLKIKYKGISYNAPLDETQLEGLDIAEQAHSAYIQGLKAGRLVTMGANGVALAAADSATVLGFLVNDADGYFYENKPALASRLVAVMYGDCIVETDQLASETYAAGDLLYPAANGKLTKTKGTVPAVAIALTAATPNNLVLEVARI